jgi:homoserine O-acetyltransferase/O-succinyltransferase
MLRRAALAVLLFATVSGLAASYPEPKESDFIVRDFRFKSGERLPEVRIHYRTLGTLQRDAKGLARNAVLVLHGTGGAGTQFLTENFAGVLFGHAQLLDADRYFIILPDNIGHGHSSSRATDCVCASRTMSTTTWSSCNTG